MMLRSILVRNSGNGGGYSVLGGTRRMFSTSSPASSHKLFDKILIANRGEIACRVMRTAQKLGIKTVAVYSEADKNSLHVAMADEAYLIGPPPPNQSYLCMDKILAVAKASGAQAIHPGYGFLSENEHFAELLEKNGVTFIGPPVPAIRAMGSKSASKDIMKNASVPIIPGYHGEGQSISLLKDEAKKIGYPVLIKAVLGGGGKGMRIAWNESELEDAVNSSKREAITSFGDDRVLVEKYLARPRHIEIQVFGDSHDNYVYLFERDCSVQRRHQKVLEEAPAPGMTQERRERMGQAAVAAARAVGYVGAGTVEFIVDTTSKEGTFYFMEMNTRLQVEHPITEMITGQDLVEWQIKVASGQHLPLRQDALKIHGHAFEARVYAEDPNSNFLPGTGTLHWLRSPQPSNHVRIETGVRQGDTVSVYYDPMIAKLVVWDKDRMTALQRTRAALEQYQIVGLHHNIDFLIKLATHPAFIAGDVETGFIEKHRNELLPPPVQVNEDGAALAALFVLLSEKSHSADVDRSSAWTANYGVRFNHPYQRKISFKDGEKPVTVDVTYSKDSYKLKVNDKEFDVTGTLEHNGDIKATVNGRTFVYTAAANGDSINVFASLPNFPKPAFSLDLPKPSYDVEQVEKGSLLSPMPGRIVKVIANINDKVTKGTPLLILEAMKMEHTIRAPYDGILTKIIYKVGDLVEAKKVLATIEESS